MGRVLILLDVTDVEADIIAEALVDVSPEFKGIGTKEALATARAMPGADTRKGVLVKFRSRASSNLGGPDIDVTLPPRES